MIEHRINQLEWWLRRNKKVLLLISPLLVVVLIQLFYPGDRLLPFASVAGQSLGGWSKTDAAQAVDEHQAAMMVDLFVGDDKEPFLSLTPSDLGVSIDSGAAIDGIDYPWYWRLIPTSLFWWQAFDRSIEPSYQRDEVVVQKFINDNFGKDCHVDSADAKLKFVEKDLVVEVSRRGVDCKTEELRSFLTSLNPGKSDSLVIRLSGELIEPKVSTSDAETLRDQINEATANGINLVASGQTFNIPREKILSWLVFSVKKSKLSYALSAKRAEEYLNNLLKDKVEVAATPTRVTTYNLIEVERENGSSGRTLDIGATLAHISDYISGKTTIAKVATSEVEPGVEYLRRYSSNDTGLLALMTNFVNSHSGTYGIVLRELTGQYRWASFNGNNQFVTASTYKLFVAYSTLLRIESGAFKWTDSVHGGRNLTKCFDDMIVVSDNECAHALLTRIGFTQITNEANAIGAISTSFLGTNIVSTANDLATLLSKLYSGQILSKQSSRDILINAMKRNIYRSGIPSGVGGTVADKVGFLWNLLHDAGIVYSSTGNYVLVIMTDNSSWANIAELTRQLEALRNQ